MTAGVQPDDELFRLLVDSVGDCALILLDPSGHVLSWNDGATEIFGYDPSEILGRHISFLYPAGADRTLRPERMLPECTPTPLVEAALRRPQRAERSLLRKDGSTFRAGITLTALRRRADALRGYSMVVHDLSGLQTQPHLATAIAARMGEVRQLKREVERTTFLAEASSALASSFDVQATLATVTKVAVPAMADWCTVLLKDDDGRLRPIVPPDPDNEMSVWGHAMAQRFPSEFWTAGSIGLAAETGEPRLIAEITDEILRAVALDDAMLRQLRAARLRSAVAVPLNRDGDVFSVMILVSRRPDRPYCEDDLPVLKRLGELAAHAIKNAEWYKRTLEIDVQLRRQSRNLSAAIASSPLATVVLDADRKVIEFNPAAERVFGWTRSEVIGQSFEGPPPDYAQRLNERVQGESWGELRNGIVIAAKTKAGRSLDVAMSAALIRDPEGNLEGTIIVFEDVTERNRFLRIAAHELRNPLAMIHTSLQLLMRRLRMQPIDVEQVKADGARILNGIQHLNALTGEVFDVVRMGEGNFPVEREPLDLVELTRNVLHRFSVGESYQLSFEAPDTPLWVLGAPRRIEQVLGNLLQNAIKYSPLGGAIRVSLAADDDRVRVAVRDEGIGIPPDDQARVFDGFFRASNIDASGPAGIGLGLYICREIMARHGGRIWLESELGRGTTVMFELDRSKADGMGPIRSEEQTCA